MAGYDGYSMSNNARAAYASGSQPMSQWSRAEFLGINRVTVSVKVNNGTFTQPEIKALTDKWQLVVDYDFRMRRCYHVGVVRGGEKRAEGSQE